MKGPELNKKNILAAGWLLAITTLVGTALMAGINRHSQPYIEENEREVLLRTLNTVIDPATYNNDIINDAIVLSGSPLSNSQEYGMIYRARKDGRPVAAVLTVTAPDGYTGPIVLLVGIRYSGEIAGVRVVRHRETPGLGDGIEYERSNWITVFSGKSLENPQSSRWKVKRDGGDFDQLTGATITPRAIVKAVHKALVFYQKNRESVFDRTDKS